MIIWNDHLKEVVYCPDNEQKKETSSEEFLDEKEWRQLIGWHKPSTFSDNTKIKRKPTKG